MRLNRYSIALHNPSVHRLFSMLLVAGFLGCPALTFAQGRPELHRPDQGQDVKHAPPSKPKEKGPRAIAVVEWRPNSQGRAVAKLLPVTILDEGKFQDAALYRATPRPMALETGVVYEAQVHGEPIGFFTIESAEQQREHWAAVGDWKSTTPRLSTGRPVTQSAQVRGSAVPPANSDESQDDRDLQKKQTTVYDEHGHEIPAGQASDDDKKTSDGKYPPTLDRRPRVAKPGEGIPPDQRTSTGTDSNGDSDPNRPRLKKNPGGTEQTKSDPVPTSSGPQTTSTSPAGSQTGQTQASDQDNDRPRLHRGATDQNSTASSSAPVSATSSASNSSRNDADPDRPVLKRGGYGSKRGGKPLAADEPQGGSPIPLRAKETGGRRLGDTEQKAYDIIAVSDADQVVDSHTFAFRVPADERDEYLKKMATLARKEVAEFRSAHYPSTTRAASAPTKRRTAAGESRAAVSRWAFSDEKFAIFDLFSNNNPQLVYTARVEPDAIAPKSPETYVTLVANLDPDGNIEKVFSSVTDASRLDVTPRMELVDAVDSNGKGRGDLLFRRNFGTDSDFILYRVAGTQLQELFHGGWAGE